MSKVADRGEAGARPAGVIISVVLLKELRGHSDGGLVAECQKGDRTAFDELVRRYKDRIYCVVYRFLGNREDALDVSQEVFVRAYRGIKEYRGAAKVYTWLYSIAANLARNRLRDSSRKGRDQSTSLEALEESAPQVLREVVVNGGNPRESAMEAETKALLQKCLCELPDHCRMAFVLRTFEDLSYEEIANAMGCPVGTVKSRLNQARKMLFERMKELEVL
ncbi:MAG: sigma-70 family RNA polymerase sigma factor [Candidatus Hydrogenedentes bacterium]|nr:sigma-70 family RNA polymerase sigma factor [Candidatus Hydrogenedentota bacterium]